MAEKIVGYRPDHNSDWYPIGGHGEPSSTEVGEMLLPFASLLEISKRSMQVKDDNGSWNDLCRIFKSVHIHRTYEVFQ